MHKKVRVDYMCGERASMAWSVGWFSFSVRLIQSLVIICCTVLLCSLSADTLAYFRCLQDWAVRSADNNYILVADCSANYVSL